MNPRRSFARVSFAIAGCALAVVAFAKMPVAYAPGMRTQVLAHNAYPDHGKYADRLDRAIAAGVPFVVEEDLAWADGRSVLVHGPKAVTGDDPTLETYFFPKVAPMMEQALKDGNKGNWPLVTVYLDIKNDPPEHLAAIGAMLDKHDAWLTTAKKTGDMATQSPLMLKPMMVLVEDKQGDTNKQKAFYDDVAVGGRVRVFGSPEKIDPNPGKKMPKDEAVERMATVAPEMLVTAKADNYHRWFGVDWAYIEKGGQEHAGAWSAEKDARLRSFVGRAHQLGYFASVYCLNGYTESENQGWDKEYNFGSRDAVMGRWKAAVAAKADFVSTDQYEDLSKVIAAKR